MLIEFTVKNFYSYQNETTLSLVASSGNELKENKLSFRNKKNSPELLRSATIYGANASGKSNLLKAAAAMRDIILKTRQSGEEIPVTPFLFDPNSKNEPTELEVIFIIDNIRYQYGFSTTAKQIYKEWLFAFPKGKVRYLFERTLNTETNEYTYNFSNHLTGEKESWKKATRSDALFLTTAIQLNSQSLKPIYDWFNSLKYINANQVNSVYSFQKILDNANAKNEILNFMQSADFSIANIEVTANPETKKMYAFTTHHCQDGSIEKLDFGLESDGTQKMTAYSSIWKEVLDNGYVLFVDELHANLHPLLVKHLVRRFHNPKTNPKGAQLIFTTHETAILNQEIFRRDQVWFCERNENQSTRLFPLTDFSRRKNVENLENAYLSGRYGALPYLTELKERFGDNECLDQNIKTI